MILEEAIEKCAAELPEGAVLSVEIENGAGGVIAENWDGDSWQADTADMTLTEQVLSALEWCKEGGT